MGSAVSGEAPSAGIATGGDQAEGQRPSCLKRTLIPSWRLPTSEPNYLPPLREGFNMGILCGHKHSVRSGTYPILYTEEGLVKAPPKQDTEGLGIQPQTAKGGRNELWLQRPCPMMSSKGRILSRKHPSLGLL